jgi:hypothetical protein
LTENPNAPTLVSPLTSVFAPSTLNNVTSLLAPPAPTRIAVPLCSLIRRIVDADVFPKSIVQDYQKYADVCNTFLLFLSVPKHILSRIAVGAFRSENISTNVSLIIPQMPIPADVPSIFPLNALVSFLNISDAYPSPAGLSPIVSVE